MICRACGADTGLDRPGRRDACPRCGADLHACAQCRFYAPGSYNDCREPRAERVLDKERANFCDWFEPGDGPPSPGDDPRARAKAQLDALFRKKGGS